MNTYSTPFGQMQPPNPYQQIQQMFPQPQGSVYQISTPSEVGNVPIGSTGLSVAICFPDQIMYIKSFQNGNPVIMAYKISPYTKEEPAPTSTPTSTAADPLEERMVRLEQLISKLTTEGGKFNGLL